MSDLQQLSQQVIEFRDERGWKRFHGSKDLILGLLVELGELAEHFQYFTGDELLEYQKDFQEEIGEELADVLFWVVLMSAELGIDLEKVFKEKMQKNEQKYPVGDIDPVSGLMKTGKMYNRWRAKRENLSPKIKEKNKGQ